MVGVQLPVGFEADGQWHRSVELRAVTGADELAVERTTTESAAALVTRLLARCVVGLGPLGLPDIARIRTLAIGDREALLLQLRRLTFGERVSAVLACPSCTERMDLELRVDELLVEPVRAERAEHDALEVPVHPRSAPRWSASKSRYRRLRSRGSSKISASLQ